MTFYLLTRFSVLRILFGILAGISFLMLLFYLQEPPPDLPMRRTMLWIFIILLLFAATPSTQEALFIYERLNP